MILKNVWFILDVSVKLIYTNKIYPLNKYFFLSSLNLDLDVIVVSFFINPPVIRRRSSSISKFGCVVNKVRLKIVPFKN
jgi:hypothetical protein